MGIGDSVIWPYLTTTMVPTIDEDLLVAMDVAKGDVQTVLLVVRAMAKAHCPGE